MENIFFSEDTREVPEPPLLSDQPLTIQTLPPNAKILVRDGKGKEVLPLAEAQHFKDTFTIKDMVTQAKDFKAGDSLEDPPQSKA